MELRGHCKSRGLYLFYMEREKEIINLEKDFFLQYRIVSAVKREYIFH